MQFAADYKVKVEDLESLIKSDLYHHQGDLPNNFKRTIPDQLQAYRAITMFKDEYLLDYINTEELFVRDKDRDEKVIEQGIINNVKNFIMTFGKDFTFVGNQYHLEKFGVEQFPDLLFFNRELACLVVVELKDGPFQTSYLGQLAGYLRILDAMKSASPTRIRLSVSFCVSQPIRSTLSMSFRTTTALWVSLPTRPQLTWMIN